MLLRRNERVILLVRETNSVTSTSNILSTHTFQYFHRKVWPLIGVSSSIKLSSIDDSTPPSFDVFDEKPNRLRRIRFDPIENVDTNI